MRHKIDYWGSLMSDRLKFINLTVSDYVNIGLYAFSTTVYSPSDCPFHLPLPDTGKLQA